MIIEIVSATDLTHEQVAAWDQLQRLDPQAAHPFFRPEFTQMAALECDGVEIAVIRQAGEYVGFFPYQRASRDVGRAVAWQMSDMHGIVLRPDVTVDAKALLREARLKAWHFDHVPVEQATFQPFFRDVDDSFRMDLSGGYDRYRDERRRTGSSLISQASRKSRRLSRESGQLRFEFRSTDESAFEALVSWKRQQLLRQHYADTFGLPWVAPFLRRVAAAQSAHFAGLLATLHAGQELVAVHLGVRCGGELCSWVPAYNARFAKFSPGLILHLELAKSARDEGVQRIDLGRGENPLKRSLSSDAARVAIGSVERRPFRGVLTAGWYGARAVAHASPLCRGPLRTFQRMRNMLGGSRATAP